MDKSHKSQPGHQPQDQTKPGQPAPGTKDTDDLSDIKGVQDQGMLQHKKDAEQRPQLVQTPAKGRRSGQS